jgi:hypothetical protein
VGYSLQKKEAGRIALPPFFVPKIQIKITYI